MRLESALPLVIALAGLSTPPALAQFPDVNPKLKSGQVLIASAFVLPPEIQFTKLGMKGAEGMTPAGDKLTETFYALLSQELAARGVKLLPNSAEPLNDAEKYAVSDLQARFDSVYIQLCRNPGGVEKGRYSLGDGVSDFVPAKHSDVLIFLRGSATEGTSARRAISPLMAWPQFRADVTFADAKSGEILARAPLHLWKDMTKDQTDRLALCIRNSLRDIPLPLKPPK